MTAPSDCDLFRNAFEEAFRDVIQAFELKTHVEVLHGYSVSVKALNHGVGVSATWFAPRDADLQCLVHLKELGTRSRSYPLIHAGGTVPVPFQWDSPPYRIEEAAQRLLQIGPLYGERLFQALAGDAEILRALRDLKERRRRETKRYRS